MKENKGKHGGPSPVPKVLTIATSDSGGGAGIQADLKTFQELQVYGMSVLAAITVQNTIGVKEVFSLPPELVRAQMQAIEEDLPPETVKLGMLPNSSIMETVSGALRDFGWSRIVLDPVMVAKGGAALMEKEAVKTLCTELIPLCFVITPNLSETAEIIGSDVRTMEQRKEAARRIHGMGARYVLIKGGHGEEQDSIDLLYDGSGFTDYACTRIVTRHNHGTGCTFASALAAGIAKGISPEEAIHAAKQFVQAALSIELGLGHGHGPTNHWAYARLKREHGLPEVKATARQNFEEGGGKNHASSGRLVT